MNSNEFIALLVANNLVPPDTNEVEVSKALEF